MVNTQTLRTLLFITAGYAVLVAATILLHP